MSRAENLRAAWSRLLDGHSYALACHVRPDGDALGSALALARVLRAHGKDVIVVCEDGVPANYQFIPESDSVVGETGRRDFDVGVLIDCEGVKRAGSAGDSVRAARVTACIDHHVPDDAFGDLRIVDTDASSTAELVVELLDANQVPIDSVAAAQLMAGLVNDTGAFRFANTSARTFRAAARLVELGASASVAAREIYESRPVRAMKLLGRALESLETDETGSIVWARITRTDFADLGCTDSDTDGIVNHVGQVRGPKVAILFREIKSEEIRVSLRSRDGVDVNRIARRFGGGGHEAAAGCTVDRSLETAIREVVTEVRRWTES